MGNVQVTQKPSERALSNQNWGKGGGGNEQK